MTAETNVKPVIRSQYEDGNRKSAAVPIRTGKLESRTIGRSIIGSLPLRLVFFCWLSNRKLPITNNQPLYVTAAHVGTDETRRRTDAPRHGPAVGAA